MKNSKDELVDIRNPTVEILEQGESTTKTSLGRRGSRAWKRGLCTTESGAETRSDREIGRGDLSDWKAEPFH